MTPRPPGGVQSPSPRTRVESLTTPIRLLLLDRAKEALSNPGYSSAPLRFEVPGMNHSWLPRMAVETRETPGVYQTLNQLKPYSPALGTVIILPP